MLKIPLFYLRDKQLFTKKEGKIRFVGKPLDVAKELKKDYKLLHFVDMDALSGRNTNLDVYNGLTYFINVQVECAPKTDIINKLLTLKCRVVLLPTAELDISLNPNLMVAKITSDYTGDADGFRDVILENYDELNAKKFQKLGKRIIVYENQKPKKTKDIWGVIFHP
ncbi:MAG: hypothetical protein ABID61_06730 [Candidatus Micrarchaeota archaeon]